MTNSQLGSNAKIKDAELTLDDGATAKTTVGGGTVSAAAKILDLGSGEVQGVCKMGIIFADISSADEAYSIELQGSNSDDFTDPDIVPLGGLRFGNTAALGTNMKPFVLGEDISREFHFTNRVDQTVYRYVRLYFLPAGTSPSVTLSAYLTTH